MTAPTAAAPFSRTSRLARLPDLLRERIVVLDGAMGTMLQEQHLDEAAFRGERFADHPKDLRGNSDVLCLTQPRIVREIHAAYLDAGADVISTNSFTSTSIAQADYGFGPVVVREVNFRHVLEYQHAAGHGPGAVADRRGRALDVELVAVLADQQHRAHRLDRADAAHRDRERVLERLAGLLVESPEDLVDRAAERTAAWRRWIRNP